MSKYEIYLLLSWRESFVATNVTQQAQAQMGNNHQKAKTYDTSSIRKRVEASPKRRSNQDQGRNQNSPERQIGSDILQTYERLPGADSN